MAKTKDPLQVRQGVDSTLTNRMSSALFVAFVAPKEGAFFGTSKNTRLLGLTVTLQKEHKKENPLGFPADDAFEGPKVFEAQWPFGCVCREFLSMYRRLHPKCYTHRSIGEL